MDAIVRIGQLESEFDNLNELYHELELRYGELSGIVDEIKSICNAQPLCVISQSATNDNVADLVRQMGVKLEDCRSAYLRLDDLFS